MAEHSANDAALAMLSARLGRELATMKISITKPTLAAIAYMMLSASASNPGGVVADHVPMWLGECQRTCRPDPELQNTTGGKGSAPKRPQQSSQNRTRREDLIAIIYLRWCIVERHPQCEPHPARDCAAALLCSAF